MIIKVGRWRLEEKSNTDGTATTDDATTKGVDVIPALQTGRTTEDGEVESRQFIRDVRGQ